MATSFVHDTKTEFTEYTSGTIPRNTGNPTKWTSAGGGDRNIQKGQTWMLHIFYVHSRKPAALS